ncbi:MAG: ATPase, T2SS/T4P/T4SS family [bacterium]|nr:ATPase, T2SS/T4P/T4SS family [bacterium]
MSEFLPPPGSPPEAPAPTGETAATAPAGAPGGADTLPKELLEGLLEHLRGELATWIEQENRAGRRPADPERRERARAVIGEWMRSLAQHRLAAGAPMLDASAEERLAGTALAYAFGTGPWERFLNAPELTDIHINGCDDVWLVDRRGNKWRGEPVAASNDELIEQIRWVGATLDRTGRRFDVSSPVLNMRLPNGGRLHAVMAVSLVPMVTIRLHDPDLARLSELRSAGMFDRAIESFFGAAVRAGFNIVVCGGMGAGKTTLVRSLLNEVPPQERIITVEDELELGLHHYADLHPDIGVLEARAPNVEGAGAFPLEALLRECLRMHADRIVVGEVRGPEVLGMLLAMTSGQDGSLCTIHANSTAEAFERLTMYASLTPQQFSRAFTYRLVGSAVDFVVHVEAIGGTRRITSIREVVGSTDTHVLSNEVWRPSPGGWAVPSGEPLRAEPTLRRLTEAGFDPALMNRPEGWWDR